VPPAWSFSSLVHHLLSGRACIPYFCTVQQPSSRDHARLAPMDRCCQFWLQRKLEGLLDVSYSRFRFSSVDEQSITTSKIIYVTRSLISWCNLDASNSSISRLRHFQGFTKQAEIITLQHSLQFSSWGGIRNTLPRPRRGLPKINQDSTGSISF
jgi:hypothetical protein